MSEHNKKANQDSHNINKPIVLVLGTTGFIGSSLYLRLVEAHTSCRAMGLDLKPSPYVKPESYVPGDLFDFEGLKETLKSLRPSYIAHCVGSYTNEFATDLKMNVTSTQNLLQATLETVPNAKVVIVSTSAVYGENSSENISEFAPLIPNNVYGLTKKYQEELAQFYHRRYSLPLVIARLFNVLGPQCPSSLFIGKFINQIRQFQNKERSDFEFGPLDAIRDYIDVRDVASALAQILFKGITGNIYNVGSGKGTSPREIVDYSLSRLSIPEQKIRSPKQGTTAGVSKSVANIQRLTSELGWQPQYSTLESINDILKSL